MLVLPNPTPVVAAQPNGNCNALPAPLSPEEMNYARSSWTYFVNNFQPSTGFMNAANGYPSGTLWDIGNYLAALNSARWLGFIQQSEFDQKLNLFLTSIGKIKLFDGKLPNKVYGAATGEMTDYGNKPIERGIGWSALDLGRLLAAFHIIRVCHPQYGDWLQSVVNKWQLTAAIKDGMLYGAIVKPDDKTLLVQEGRLGYEEYAVRGFKLWGFDAPKALAFDPFDFVNIYGIKIPYDKRDYQTTNANNYVVSESYLLDAIEFGLTGELADYASRVFEVQKRRYEDTKLLTAVSEDNINKAPYFIYNTVYANGKTWAAITENNELHPELKSLSTKAAFGWHYVYPQSEYGRLLFDKVKDLCKTEKGYVAGIYEAGLNDPSPPLNSSLTGNTNGLILEILYYKARGNFSLITGVPAATLVAASSAPAATPSPAPSPAPSSTPSPTPSPAPNRSPSPAPPAAPAAASPAPSAPKPPALSVAAIPPVGEPRRSSCPIPERPLSLPDQRYARTAWKYFEANYHTTGLVDDRGDLAGTTLWGTGDYLASLHAAKTIGVITPQVFDQRVRQLLGALKVLPLFAGELPARSYNTQTLSPIDYGGTPVAGGTGWSGLDIGRMLAALHMLKACHPEYTDAVDKTALDWSYLRVVRNGLLSNAVLQADDTGRSRIRVNPTSLLGYEEYAARAFQLWGFDVSRSEVGEQYKTQEVEGYAVPVQRHSIPPGSSDPRNTISTPFILYGMEFGFDPQMRSLIDAMFHAEATRYRQSGVFSASGSSLIDQPPYIVHSTIVSNGKPWLVASDDGKPVDSDRIASTAIAFAYYTLFPNDPYSHELWQASLDLYNPVLGYYEGFYETSGKPAVGFTSSTNSLVLQALLHKATHQQPLIQPLAKLDSPWWDSIRRGGSGQGLPESVNMPIEMVSDDVSRYWVTVSQAAPQAAAPARSSTLANEIAFPKSSSAKPQYTPIAFRAPALSEPSAARPTDKLLAQVQPRSLSDADRIAATRAWKYFENNWNSTTGLINSVDRLPWATLWDQGSAILAIHAGRQLGLLPADRFDQWMNKLLRTLETMPLPSHKLPNKAYSTATAEMRTLSNRPDPNGQSGWSALDVARYLAGLNVLHTQYPAYRDRIDRIVRRYDLTQLVKDGWLYGGIPDKTGKIQRLQEGRLGYEQYAANALKLWQLEAPNALNYPPTQFLNIDGITIQIDQRNFANSGASNYFTSDPYLLWGMELGWSEMGRLQADRLLSLQENRSTKTGILTAVNEDSLDRSPYFLYYSVYADGRHWDAVDVDGRSHPDLRFLSTKAAFSWAALYPDSTYAQTLRASVQNLADPNRGYLSGRYEDLKLGPNRSIDINTNTVILESLLYRMQGYQPFIKKT